MRNLIIETLKLKDLQLEEIHKLLKYENYKSKRKDLYKNCIELKDQIAILEQLLNGE
jgi:hypothetical protein